jgi:hypothetical protein
MQRVFFNARFNILTNPGASFARSPFSRAVEVLVNRPLHFVQVCKHLIVPESKNSIVSGLQKRSTNLIFLRKLCVLRAIEFNNEVSFDRAEVSKVRTNRMLTPEFYVAHAGGLADVATRIVQRRFVLFATFARFAAVIRSKAWW